MRFRHSLIPLALALALFAAGCSDGALPTGIAAPLANVVESSTGLHVLRQAPTAPPLETYRVSFWAYKGAASTVTVNYQPGAGQSVGQPFLRFDIARNGLLAGGGGVPLRTGDSVAVTLTIDSVRFAVNFQPSGVVFSPGSVATLTLWYQNADPDLNGDGVVDAADEALKQQLALWYRRGNTYSWLKLSSDNDTTLPAVSTALYHFSEYAVSW